MIVWPYLVMQHTHSLPIKDKELVLPSKMQQVFQSFYLKILQSRRSQSASDSMRRSEWSELIASKTSHVSWDWM